MFVFVCWTPYQIFNAVNFVTNNVEGSKDNADIYIYHEFNGSEKISKCLKEKNIFSNVYDVEQYDKKRVWYSGFNKVKRLFFPELTIKRYLKENVDMKAKRYKTLVISGNNLFSVNLYNVIKNLTVYFIDDGIGSYFGDMRADDMTLAYRVFNEIFHKGPLSYDVKKIYVNNREICKTKICDNIVQLPQIDRNAEITKICCEIFSYKENNLYKYSKCVYLGQPYFEVPEYIQGSEEKILDVLLKIWREQGEVICRLHPRQREETFSEMNIDTIRNLWEIECVNQIENDSILIGGFSTAQFMPKILVNKEPYIVFLYKMLYPLEYTGRWDRVIERFKELYEDKKRIFIPQNLDEFQYVLSELKNIKLKKEG